jgi:cellulase/cellobiase CelA1
MPGRGAPGHPGLVDQPGPRATQGTSASQVLPPYSIETVVLTPQAGSQSGLTAPGSPTVSNVTDTQATVSWSPSSSGQVARYGVYRQFGTDSELLGDFTSGSFTVNNLTPGTTYTVNVLATDQRGYLSPPSAPVTFTTGSPASGGCTVSYDVTDGWSSGFVANLSITDTGPNPVNGWTLAFTFPPSTESVSSSNWNANWTEDGQNVLATNVNWDGYLAPNASVTLNGTVCSTTYSS